MVSVHTQSIRYRYLSLVYVRGVAFYSEYNTNVVCLSCPTAKTFILYTVDRQLHHVVCSVVDSPQSTCCSCLHSAFYSTCLPSLHSAYSYMQIADITSLHTKMACLQFTCCTPRILDPAGLPGIHPSGAYVASHPLN